MSQMISFISILYLVIFFALCRLSNTCWGVKVEYGSMTEDQELRVGSPIELICTLKSDIINIDGKDLYVNASYLTFVKPNGHYIDAEKIQVVSTLKSKLKIESSKVEDSGLYYCRLTLGNITRPVCASTVSIGYEPQKSSIDFRCVSNYQELKCKWKTEPSKLKTDSVLKENPYYELYRLPNAIYKKCPILTRDGNTWLCKWTYSSNPPYSYNRRVFEFLIETNNSLGRKSNLHHINHFEIVLPPKPQKVDVQNSTQNSIELVWLSPAQMENFRPGLLYQMMYRPQRKINNWKVINTTGSSRQIFHNITDLVPNTVYDIIIRCRSPFAKGDDMWSENVTIEVQTRPDVPYFSPNITKQAFEVKQSQHNRAIVIRWEHVSEEYWNGEDFHYFISNHPTRTKREERIAPYFSSRNVTVPYAIFDNLDSDSAYYFKIFSANNNGHSRNFSSITVDSSEKLPNVPEDITVISHSHGHYNISWKPPSINSTSIKNYTLFWCDELRPRPSPCEGSIHWKHVTKTNLLLNISDEKTNFQFAVAANSERSSSGMEWALCVVPYNGMPYKLRDFSVHAKNSTSLHVTWKLECSAQKAIIEEFHVIYCKEYFDSSNCVGSETSKRVSNNSAEDYYITDLVPFTLYRIYVRILAYGGQNVSSEFKHQQTLSGAPDDPPRDIKILSTTNSSIEFSWKPPNYPNGVLTNYILIYNGFSHHINNTTNNKIMLENNIMPFTNYSIQLKACVGKECSPPSEPIYVLTDVGIPGMMKEPRIEIINTSFASVLWNAPLPPNGPIDYYLLYLQPNKDYNATVREIPYAKTVNITGTATSTIVNVECPITGKGLRYSFQLQPVNKLHNNVLLVGRKTKPTRTLMCLLYPAEGSSSEMIVSIIVGSAVGCAILLIVAYMFIRWMKKKYDLLKQIKVRLPTGLDTPNRCTPGTYQDFKKDLLQHCPYPAQIKQRPGSFILDAEKNRHGSGNSQYSNISADELLIKKANHCDIYRRNPSGDSSSGCSSSGGHDSISSSNTNQTHVSTDSGAEIDFPPLSAGDNVFLEQSSIKKPIVFMMPELEVKDSSDNDSSLDNKLKQSEKNECSGYGLDKKLCMPACSNIAKNVPVLHPAYLQPYSKFGLNQIKDGRNNYCSRQWNMLAYVSNLANSEPSVAELDSGNSDNYNSSLMPYSKLTFSKSLENIHENSIDYSKCGIISDDTIYDFNSVKLPHHTSISFYQNDKRTGNTNSVISAKQDYVSVETCLKNRNKVLECNKMLPLNKDINGITSNNVIDSMAYSKFDIKPLGVLSTDLRPNPMTTGYIPIHQANCMVQTMDMSHITTCSPFDDSTDKELCLSNASLPTEIMVSAIIDPCVKQCAINGLNSAPVDFCDSFFLYTNHSQDQETIPVSFSCDGTEIDENKTALNEKESTEQYWECTSLSDINLNIDIRPEEPHKCDKLCKSEEQANSDEQASIKTNSVKELEVVMSPGSLNYSTASVPAYRFHSQPYKVEQINSKNGYVNISPVYYV